MSHVTNHLQNMIYSKTNGELAVMVEDLANQLRSDFIEDEMYWQIDHLYGECIEELVRRGSW